MSATCRTTTNPFNLISISSQSTNALDPAFSCFHSTHSTSHSTRRICLDHLPQPGLRLSDHRRRMRSAFLHRDMQLRPGRKRNPDLLKINLCREKRMALRMGYSNSCRSIRGENSIYLSQTVGIFFSTSSTRHRGDNSRSSYIASLSSSHFVLFITGFKSTPFEAALTVGLAWWIQPVDATL